MQHPQIKSYLYSKAAVKHVPLAGTFELTPCCNMNCRMCYVRLSKQEQERMGRLRTAEEWISLGKICRDAGMLFLLLTGGEPFLRPDFREIYEKLYDMGLMISINTNGTLLTKETVDWLIKRPPERVNVTLYGGSRETYEELCRYPEGYDRAVKGILMLKNAGIHVSINASHTGENARDMEQIYAFVKEYKLPMRMTSYMFPPVRKKEGNDTAQGHRLPPKQAGHVMFQSMQLGCTKESWAIKREKLLAGLPADGDDCPRDEKMRCMAGRSTFWVTWNWQLRACGTMTEPSLKLEPGRFLEDWEELGGQIDKLLLPKACSSCKLRSLCIICGASAQAEGQGDMEKRPQYVCEMIEEYARLLHQEIKGTDKCKDELR